MFLNALRMHCVLLPGMILVAGCQSSTDSDSENTTKLPRPVSVSSLQLTAATAGELRVNASVDSWKTDKISAEVAGQIEWVEEQNALITGTDKMWFRKEGIVLEEGSTANDYVGDPIARIDDEVYRLRVSSAEDQIARTLQKIKSSESNIENLLPAQIRAAQADEKLAGIELERSQQLFAEQATAQAEVDRYQAKYDNAVSVVAQLQSSLEVEKINLQSLEIEKQQNEKSLLDAKINLRNCVVYSRFNGQLTSVEVVAGSNVTPGQAIATVQMMNPIKIEFEASSETSRLLRGRKLVTVQLPNSRGADSTRQASLFEIDSVADPQTRTYTVKLLMINDNLGGLSDSGASNAQPSTPGNSKPGESAVDNKPVDGRTLRAPAPLDLPFFKGGIDEKSGVALEAWIIDLDGPQPFLLKVENYEEGTVLPKNRVLSVRKVPVKVNPRRMLFYGDFYYRQVTILDPGQLDPQRDYVIPRLIQPENEQAWLEKMRDWQVGKSYRILVDDASQWLLRPGDLVEVNIGERNTAPEMSVPMSAILHEDGRYYLFLVPPGSKPGEVVPTERKEIIILDDLSREPIQRTSTMLRIGSSQESESLADRQYVTRGAHYLRDGETVKIVAEGN
ncbi:MAG: HlyD family efflux transporter periplasmic adaptor subunit [Planctomycetota bacterium]|nr:HlyD family efflux transporter periplasmic adaptor subunit [Planctomycetota bacterium]